MVEDDLYNESGDTPSQVALDQLQQNTRAVEAAHATGGLSLARSQVADAVRDGADAAKGREILGTIDEMERYPDTANPEATAKLYNDHKNFIRSAGAAPQAAQAPSTPPKRVIDKNKARKDYIDGKTNEYPG